MFSSSCCTRIGFKANDLVGISDYMVDLIFIELFGTLADRFPINYWSNLFPQLIVGQIDWQTSNLKSRAYAGDKQRFQTLVCHAPQDSPRRILRLQ